MKTLPLSLELLQRIKVRAFEISDFGDNGIKESYDYFLSSTESFALVDDEGEVIAVLGGKVFGTVCHAWMLASDLMYKYPVATLKLILKLHKLGIEKHGVKKFFTYNLPEFRREIEYLESIGYRNAGSTDDFDDGKERLLFVREVF